MGVRLVVVRLRVVVDIQHGQTPELHLTYCVLDRKRHRRTKTCCNANTLSKYKNVHFHLKLT